MCGPAALHARVTLLACSRPWQPPRSADTTQAVLGLPQAGCPANPANSQRPCLRCVSQFKALTRITVKPLVETLPCLGGVTVSLMEVRFVILVLFLLLQFKRFVPLPLVLLFALAGVVIDLVVSSWRCAGWKDAGPWASAV